MSHPQQAVQSCHAIIEATKSFDFKNLPCHPSVIILSAKDEHRLNRVRNYLIEQGINHVHFCEPDLNGQMTSIATEPLSGNKRNALKKYQLFDNTPHGEITKYVVKYPDGYYSWSGECGNSPDRTGVIECADLFDDPISMSDGVTLPVNVRFHIGGVR